MFTPDTPKIPTTFLDNVLQIEDIGIRLRWYMCTVVTLSSLNYSDVIPQIYKHFDANYLASLSTVEARKEAINHLREALIKSTGIVGAGRTGNAMRALSRCVPEAYRATESPRAQESDATARARGKKFWSNIYARNPDFDPEASVRASPDYAFVVRDVLYARIFSYDGILDDLTTGYVMVSGLYGLDCQNQLQHHMKGMLWNGATRQDLIDLRALCLGIADILDVRFRHPPAPIPVLPE